MVSVVNAHNIDRKTKQSKLRLCCAYSDMLDSDGCCDSQLADGSKLLALEDEVEDELLADDCALASVSPPSPSPPLPVPEFVPLVDPFC